MKKKKKEEDRGYGVIRRNLGEPVLYFYYYSYQNYWPEKWKKGHTNQKIQGAHLRNQDGIICSIYSIKIDDAIWETYSIICLRGPKQSNIEDQRPKNDIYVLFYFANDS